MGRNIVVCCDGTANQFTKHNTNVVKLYSTLIDDPARQLIFYHPGIGTREAPGALTSIGRWLTIMLGQAVGYGLERDITETYAFVMNNYRAGDHLYLFGFSRGAYTVRAVAALLRAFGVLRAGHETSIPYAIRLLNAVSMRKEGDNEIFRIQDNFKATFASGDCKPYFAGVWDTVSSVGWIGNPLEVDLFLAAGRRSRYPDRPSAGSIDEIGDFPVRTILGAERHIPLVRSLAMERTFIVA